MLLHPFPVLSVSARAVEYERENLWDVAHSISGGTTEISILIARQCNTTRNMHRPLSSNNQNSHSLFLFRFGLISKFTRTVLNIVLWGVRLGMVLGMARLDRQQQRWMHFSKLLSLVRLFICAVRRCGSTCIHFHTAGSTGGSERAVGVCARKTEGNGNGNGNGNRCGTHLLLIPNG
jgi:hypothetical protein